ncbi:MAG: energy transducer TonB [Cytophagales bacterium]|nr:energy transducer TonB [Cytophagales bacterium]
MSKAALLTSFLLLGATGVWAQGAQSDKVNVTFYSDYRDNVNTSRQPEFPGGYEALKQFFVRKFEANPGLDFKKRAWIKAVVNAQGTVTALEVIGESNPRLREELSQTAAAMPKWQPGLVNGQPVKADFSFQPYAEKK